jgi:hypothetical protein
MSTPGHPGSFMRHELYMVLFPFAAGLTASGIAANLYRLVVRKKAETGFARMTYLAVMVIAGPSVLFDNAAKAWRSKSGSWLSFCVAASIASYWSLAIGLLVIQLAFAVG